jgi:hypothetical protein
LPTELLFYGGVEVSGNKILLKDPDTRILTLARDFPDEQNTLKSTSSRRTEGQQQHLRRHLGIDVRRWPRRPLYHTITEIVEADLTLRAAWPSGRHSVRTSSARSRTYRPSYWRAHEAPLGSILGLLQYRLRRFQARIDRRRLLHRRTSGSSSVDDSYCGRGLPEGWRSSYVPRFAAPTSKC